MTELIMISPAKLTPSPTNPRRDLGDLAELTESIRQHGVIEPIVARPARRKGQYEVVCGHRRHAAAQVIGSVPVPVLVRELDDDQVLDLQLAENMERSDLTALEEAEAFQLRISRGQTVERIATRIGRSVGYVAQRLRLLEIHEDVQQALREEAITVSVAQLLGRLPLPLQAECLEDVQVCDLERPLTTAQAKEAMGRHLRRLDRAPFDVADVSLGRDEEHRARGACTTCPMRSGNQGSLFDADESDYCLDDLCYKAKCSAMARRAELAGTTVLRGAEASKALGWSGEWVRLDRKVWIQPDVDPCADDADDADDTDGGAREVRLGDILAEQGSDHEITLVFYEDTGELVEVVPRHVQLQAVDRAEGRAPTQENGSVPKKPGDAEAKRKAKEALRKRAFEAYITQALEHAEGIVDHDLFGLLVRALARQTEHTRVLRILKRHGIEQPDRGASEALCHHAHNVAPGLGLERLALELVLENAIPWYNPCAENDWDDDGPDLWDDAQRVIAALGLLDVRGVEKELIKADKAKADKAKADKAKAKRKEATL